jgi:hypothetical protein
MIKYSQFTAVRTPYRILLRSSSLSEPIHPPLNLVFGLYNTTNNTRILVEASFGRILVETLSDEFSPSRGVPLSDCGTVR